MRIKKTASFNVKEGVKSVRYSDLNSGIQYLPADGIINIKSEKVRIAGFGVNESSLYKIDVNGTPYSIGSANSIYLSNTGIITSKSIGGSKGTLSWAMAISDKFGVTVDGTLYAMGGHFAGTIEAKSGKIGTTLINEDGSIVSANGGFRLDANGDLTISHVGGSQLVQDAQTALSTANTAVSNAKTAQDTANSANTNAENQKYYRIIECASHSNDYAGTGIWLKINNVQQTLNNLSRGLNVASINPITLAVEGTWGFDTFAGGDNITNFNSKIAELNGGDHIIVVMSYDASYPSRVADALRSIGGTVYTPGSSYRESYVLIGKSNLGYGNGVERYNPSPAINKWQAIVSCRVSENGALMSSNSGSLASYTKTTATKADNAQTTANTAVANAKTAQDTANDAKSKAENAQSRATTLENWRTSNVDVKLNHAYNVINHWAQNATSDSTTINGGLIQTNTITADKIAIGDFTNIFQMNKDNCGKYGFNLDTSGSTAGIYHINNVERDHQMGDFISCKGGEQYYISADIYSSCHSNDGTWYPIGVGIHTVDVAYNNPSWVCLYAYPTNDNRLIHIEGTVTSSPNAGLVRAFFQISDDNHPIANGYKGSDVWVSNCEIRKMNAGELIVDGAITTNKLASKSVNASILADDSVDGRILADNAISNSNFKDENYGTSSSWINLKTGKMNLGGKLTWDGSNLSINGNGSFSGDITATSGKIASFTIRGKYLESSDEEVGMSAGDTSFWAGWNSSDGSYKFKVTKDGALTANNATLKGSITSVGSDNTKIDISNGKISFYKNNSDNDYTSVIKGLAYAVNPDTEAVVSGSTTLIGVKSDDGMILLSTDYKKDVDRFASNILISKRKVRTSVRSNDDTHVSMLNTEPFNEKMSIYEKNTDADKATKGSMNYDKMAMIRLTKANNAYQVIIRADDIFVSKLSEAPARYTVEADKKVTAHYTMTKIEEYIAEYVYPVGALYISVDFRDPSEVLGFGAWDPIEDKFLLGGSAYNREAGQTGGSETVTLTAEQMPVHNHTAWTDTQGDHSHISPTHTDADEGNTNYGIAYKSNGYRGRIVLDGSYGNKYTYTSTNGAHSHNVGIGNSGGGKAHNNMPPYYKVYIWIRTA